jgi:hypothetical protein
MHWQAAFGMGSSPRCLKNRLAGAYFGSKARILVAKPGIHFCGIRAGEG